MSRDDRIVVTGGPWPERIGCIGVVLHASGDAARRYPFAGCGENEVVIALDSDPLPLDKPGRYSSQGFSCVIDRSDIAPCRTEVLERAAARRAIRVASTPNPHRPACTCGTCALQRKDANG